MKLRRALCSYDDFGEFLYDCNEKRRMEIVYASNAYKRISCMKKSIERSYLTLLAMISAVCFAVMIFSTFPAYMWFIKQNYVWLLPVLVPFTELKKMSEFYLNISFQITFSTSALLSATCMDLFFALCICHHGTASMLIEQSLLELDVMWISNTNSLLTRKAKLFNILLQFQDLNKWFFKQIYKLFVKLLKCKNDKQRPFSVS